jgi:hypothetical protein
MQLGSEGVESEKTTPFAYDGRSLSASHSSREGWGTVGWVASAKTPSLQNPGVNEYPRETPNRVARGELNS